jgi:hypothetical protein
MEVSTAGHKANVVSDITDKAQFSDCFSSLKQDPVISNCFVVSMENCAERQSEKFTTRNVADEQPAPTLPAWLERISDRRCVISTVMTGANCGYWGC